MRHINTKDPTTTPTIRPTLLVVPDEDGATVEVGIEVVT